MYNPISMDDRQTCEANCLAAGAACVGYSMSWAFDENYVNGEPEFIGCQMYGPGFEMRGCSAGGGNVLVLKTPALPCSLTAALDGTDQS